MVEADPTVVGAFCDSARRAAPVLVAGNVDADGPARRADEHVVFDRILAAEVVSAVDPAFGGFKGFSFCVMVNLSAPIFDRDRALSNEVVDVSRMVGPRACDFADRSPE